MPDTPNPRYESLLADFVDPANHFSGKPLGVRDETGLKAAFVQSSAQTNESARITLETYAGENPMFPQYRRNFVPDGGSLTEEYTDVRNKNMKEDEIESAHLGTPYTPTIASPGEEEGINHHNLRSIKGAPTLVMNSAPLNEDNPANNSHKNIDEHKKTDNIGSVRRFKLGVGSGGSTPQESRGQFPRSPA